VVRPERRLHWTLIGSVALVLSLGAGLGGRSFILHRSGAAIESHQAELAQIEQRPLNPRPTRPAIEGPPEAGSVWDLLRPAMRATWGMDPEGSSSSPISPASEANFNLHGIPAGTLLLLEASRPHLEACRRSLRRGVLDWEGPALEDLPYQATRICRALCSMAFRSWQEGRDAEAVDWLITALSVAQDVARIGQKESRTLLRVVEDWAVEESRFLLSEQGLSAGELEDFERRLDLLRSLRPTPAAEVREWGARIRREVLEDTAVVEIPVLQHETGTARLSETVGWRDLYSTQLQLARVLTELRDAAEESVFLPWNSSGALEAGWTALSLRYRPGDVRQLWSQAPGFGPELQAALRWDLLRIAVAAARFLAAHGRMPQDLAELRIPVHPSRPVAIEGVTLSSVLTRPGNAEPNRYYDLAPIELEWTIRRR
jgi:hypothetical protein